MALNHVCPHCGNPHVEVELAACTMRLDVHGLWVNADDYTQDEYKALIEQPNTPVLCPRCQWDGVWGELTDVNELHLGGIQFTDSGHGDILPMLGVELDIDIPKITTDMCFIWDTTAKSVEEANPDKVYRITQTIEVPAVWNSEKTGVISGRMSYYLAVCTSESCIRPVVFLSRIDIKRHLFHGTGTLALMPKKETTPIDDATRDRVIDEEIAYLRGERPQFDEMDDDDDTTTNANIYASNSDNN